MDNRVLLFDVGRRTTSSDEQAQVIGFIFSDIFRCGHTVALDYSGVGAGFYLARYLAADTHKTKNSTHRLAVLVESRHSSGILAVLYQVDESTI